MKTTEVTDMVLVKSLNSRCCPACGNLKKRAQTLCLRDYRRLPVAMRAALYNQVRLGYREAVIEALQFLDVHEPRLPPEPVSGRIARPDSFFRE